MSPGCLLSSRTCLTAPESRLSCWFQAGVFHADGRRVGYTFMGLAALFAAPRFTGPGLAPWVRLLSVASGRPRCWCYWRTSFSLALGLSAALLFPTYGVVLALYVRTPSVRGQGRTMRQRLRSGADPYQRRLVRTSACPVRRNTRDSGESKRSPRPELARWSRKHGGSGLAESTIDQVRAGVWTIADKRHPGRDVRPSRGDARWKRNTIRTSSGGSLRKC